MEANTQFDTPILFLIFNRPDFTEIVFKRIREVKPKYLFIAADGPRLGSEDDKIKCNQTRKIVLDLIDWDCEVKTLFRENNLGCGIAVSEAISWFFEEVEEGIILEDDCLPSIDFFTFVIYLLEYYREDESVMHISGNNFQKKGNFRDSYYFSKYSHIWGWATWRNRWQKYIQLLDRIDVEKLKNFKKEEKQFWINQFDRVYIKKTLDTWDLKWQYTLFHYQGISILPNVNLVTNIGEVGTHFSQRNHLINIPTGKITEIANPKIKVIDTVKDRFTFNKYYDPKHGIKQYLKKILNRIQ